MNIDQSAIDDFLNRFSSFYDAVIRDIEIIYRHGSVPTSVSILISTRDIQTTDNEGWVSVSLRLKGVAAFNLSESTRESFQVMSDGLKIGRHDGALYFDFGYFDELPSDPEKLRTSKFYVLGTNFDWEVSDYKP